MRTCKLGGLRLYAARQVPGAGVEHALATTTSTLKKLTDPISNPNLDPYPNPKFLAQNRCHLQVFFMFK